MDIHMVVEVMVIRMVVIHVVMLNMNIPLPTP